jgi:hypothetical protein
MTYAFISYSRKDVDYVEKLVEKLEHEGFGYWLDKRINTGADWFNEIEEKIIGCGAFLIVMTPNSRESNNVTEDDNKPIFPLLLDGRRFGILAHKQYEDVRGGKLPSAKFYDVLSKFIPASQQDDDSFLLDDDSDISWQETIPGFDLLNPEERIILYLARLIEVTRAQSAQLHIPGMEPISNEVYFKVGEVFVYASSINIYAGITISLTNQVEFDVPFGWWKLEFDVSLHGLFFSHEQFANYLDRNSDSKIILRRSWGIAEYANNFEDIAIDLIDATRRLGIKLEELNIVSSGL